MLAFRYGLLYNIYNGNIGRGTFPVLFLLLEMKWNRFSGFIEGFPRQLHKGKPKTVLGAFYGL